eukprot:1161504-Pelagomonas_calceolata.AAC.3
MGPPYVQAKRAAVLNFRHGLNCMALSETGAYPARALSKACNPCVRWQREQQRNFEHNLDLMMALNEAGTYPAPQEGHAPHMSAGTENRTGGGRRDSKREKESGWH